MVSYQDIIEACKEQGIETMQYCPRCGEALSDGWVCPFCGYQ